MSNNTVEAVIHFHKIQKLAVWFYLWVQNQKYRQINKYYKLVVKKISLHIIICHLRYFSISNSFILATKIKTNLRQLPRKMRLIYVILIATHLTSLSSVIRSEVKKNCRDPSTCWSHLRSFKMLIATNLRKSKNQLSIELLWKKKQTGGSWPGALKLVFHYTNYYLQLATVILIIYATYYSTNS